MKGPHGKGAHPSIWGLGAARARTPRKTVLKRVKMRFILRKHRAQALPSSATHRGGESTAQADVGHGIMRGTIGPTRENPRVRPGPTGTPRYLPTSRRSPGFDVYMKPIIAIIKDPDKEIQQNEPNHPGTLPFLQMEELQRE